MNLLEEEKEAEKIILESVDDASSLKSDESVLSFHSFSSD